MEQSPSAYRNALTLATHWYLPQTEIELDVTDAPGPFGIFGSCKILTLIFDKPLIGKRIVVQDLAANEAFDVTGKIRVNDRRLQLTEAHIKNFGLGGALERRSFLTGSGLIFAPVSIGEDE